MKKEVMLLLILILTTTVTAQVPTYQLECVLPAPQCTSVDLSPDGTKLCARMQYGGWNEGYRVFESDTSDMCNFTVLNDCGGYAAPWIGRVSTDSKYLYTTLYYNGCVAKIDLSTCAELPRIPVGPWPYGLAFDSQRRYLYVGVNVPGTGTTGSLKVVDTLIDQVTCNVSLGGEPGRCIVVGPNDEFVYLVTQNLGSEVLYKFTAAPGCGVAGTLPLPGVGRGAISVNPDGKTVYVPDVDGNLVHIIDTGTMSLLGSWSIPSVVGFFVSPDGTHALVVGSSPYIRVFDLVTETVVQTISIPDMGTSFGPGKSIPYWDVNNGKVYINLSATEGGVAVLVPEPEPLTGRIAFYTNGWRISIMNADGTSRYEVPLPYEQLPIVQVPQWSPDGEWLTFHGATGHNGQIYIVRPDGSGFHRVTDGSGNLVNPSFSPDGSQVAFHRVYGHLYTINTDGTGLTDHGVNVSHSRWSPDGRYVAYTNWGFGSYPYRSDVFVYDFTTGNSAQITHHDPDQAFIWVAWSPDGTKLAVSVLDWTTVQSDIWVMNADGSDPRNLTTDWTMSSEDCSSWSPDGEYIVFQSNRSGNLDIWYTPVDHFAPINITNSPEIDEYGPVWSVPEPAVIEVTIDIKPGSCPNPLNVQSKGVLPVAILGSEDFDVTIIDVASIRLADAAPIRSSFEDVATPVSDGNECDCTTEGPDGYIDLTLKFKTQDIVEELVKTQANLVHGQTMVLTLTGVLSDEISFEGTDCVVVRGKVPKPIHAKISDVNGDGVVNMLDFVMLAGNWLESAAVDD